MAARGDRLTTDARDGRPRARPSSVCRLAEGRWRGPRACSRRRSRPARPRGARGAQLGGVVARRRRHRVRAPRAGLRALQASRGDPADAARMATWLAARRARLPRRDGAGAPVAAARAPPARPLEPGPEHGWLRSTRATSPTPPADAGGARAGRSRGRARAALRRRGPGDARARTRGRDARRMRARSRRACAASTRRPRPRWRARRRSRSPARGRSASSCPRAPPCCDFERASEWCDRIAGVRASATAVALHARLLPRRVRRRPPLARPLDRGRGDARGRPPSDFARSRPAVGRVAARRARRAAARQGRAARRAATARRGGRRSRARSCAASGSRSTRGEAAQAADLLERLLRQLPRTAISIERRRSSCSSTPVPPAASTTRRPQRWPRCVKSRAPSARRRCAPAPTWRRARWPRPAATTIAPAPCSRTPSTPSSAAARRTRPRGPARAGDEPDRARPHRGGGTRAARCADASRSARSPPRGRAGGADPGRGRPEPGLAALTPREHEVLRLLAEGLTNRQIAERLVVSEHTVHRHVTNLLRKLELPSRTAAAAHAVRSGMLDRPGA